MKRIRSNYRFLELLRKVKPKLRRAILLNCGPGLLKSVGECALNVLRGNVKLTKCSRRKLRKHKDVLRKIADKKVKIDNKRKIIVQRGGFLLPLLSAVLPFLASLVFRPRS